jgi:dTDP-glucose 4,6-dehydratase
VSAWLVTGGAGFIGADFVRLAAARGGVRLVVLDALTYAGDLGRIADLIEGRRIDFVRGDICDAPLLAELFARHRFSHVAHFAAESHVDRSIDGPLPFVRTNVEGTCRLLDAARAAWTDGAPGRLFLHVSTDEVFGDLGPGEPPFTEASPYRPSSPYSASKAASDHLVRAWARTFGLPAAIANCTNNYGPWQHPEKLIPLMALNALEGRAMPVYGDGLQRRDWLHVEDCCEALLAILASGRAGETWMVGGGEERANLEIVRAICAVADELAGRPPGSAEKLIRHVTDRLGHDRRYATDGARLRAELGWRPRRRLDEALPEVVRHLWRRRGQPGAGGVR